MANDNWPIWTTVTTGTTATNWAGSLVLNAGGANYTYPVPAYVTPSAGHIPNYDPPALAEDEMAWLRRRVTEVTDLFPAAA
jgi:hypothetical protein